MEWTDSGVLRARIHRKVSLAVLVIDDLTGKSIHSSDLKLVCKETRAKAIGKPDGYYIFLDCPVSVLTVEVSAWAYHGTTVAVELASLPPLHPAIKIRLTPNRRYAIPAGTTCLEGQAKPGTRVFVHCENDPKPLRLLYDYEADHAEIQIYDPAGQNHEGRILALLVKGEKAPHFLTLGDETDGEGGYTLGKPYGKPCPKAGTTLLPVSCVTADENGDFFLPLPPLAVQTYQCAIQWEEDGKNHLLKQEIPCGKVTAIHLDQRR